MGQQDFHIGRPITPNELKPLDYRERRQRVMDAINQLGPPNQVEEPLPPDPVLAASAQAWSDHTGVHPGLAALFCLLEQLAQPSPEIASLVAGAHAGVLQVPDTAQGRWLADLARPLFGPRGPKVVVG